MNTVSPERAGIKSCQIKRFIDLINKRGLHMHSMLMMRGNDIFYEGYWAPYNKDSIQRMYSVTKSFVSCAIGLCCDDGLINLDDKIVDYFRDKIDTPLDENLKNQTIRQMLTMTTARPVCSWFSENDPDRTHLYLNHYKKRRPSGTVWEYDSAGSQVLSSLVERVTKKSLLDFLKERIFSHLGTFENAKILKTPNGDSWGDSALICTLRDLASFGRFVMNYGVHNGKRLLSEEYLKKATTKQVDNTEDGHRAIFHLGYGYQFWITEEDGFALVGMGDQLCVCIPKYDFIFCCTADNQGNERSREYLITSLFDNIINNLSDTPLDENEIELNKLKEQTSNLELYRATGQADSELRAELNDRAYLCDENPMNISEFSFHFDDKDSGYLSYTKDGNKLKLDFCVNKNRFGYFPELGYSKDVGKVATTDGHKYKDAVSMAWLQDNKIMIFAQIIDEYLGNTSLIFGFNGDKATIMAKKAAEYFLFGYEGLAIAKRKM